MTSPGRAGSSGVRRRSTKPVRIRASSTGWSPWMLWPAPSTVTTRSLGRRRRNSASSASSTTGRGSPGPAGPATAIRSRSSHWRAEVDRAPRGGRLVADGRPADGARSSVPSSRWTALCSTPRRSEDTDRVGIELDGPLEDLVEGGEALRAGQERGDVRALVVVDPGGDVDQGQEPATSSRMAGGQGDGGRPAERHARPPRRPRAPARRRPRPRRRPWPPDRGHGGAARPVGVPVAGQVDGHQRPVEGQGDGVPGVRVLAPAVEEHQLGRLGSPHQGAQPAAGRHLHRVRGGRRAARSTVRPASARVLVEQRELVVGSGEGPLMAGLPAGSHRAHSTSSPSVSSATADGV